MASLPARQQDRRPGRATTAFAGGEAGLVQEKVADLGAEAEARDGEAPSLSRVPDGNSEAQHAYGAHRDVSLQRPGFGGSLCVVVEFVRVARARSYGGGYRRVCGAVRHSSAPLR